MLFIVLISGILFLYVLLILGYVIGWVKTKEISQDISCPKVSIIIAIRNEEECIVRLLKDLKSQIYTKDKLEVILVNDHSTDNTQMNQYYIQRKLVLFCFHHLPFHLPS